MSKKLLFRYLISISFCLFASVNVPAQTDWFFVALTGSGNTIYIDKNFTKRRGGITQVWQKSVSADDNYTISLTEWNCAQKSFRFVQSAVYENDVIVDRSSRKTTWRYFVPDSTGMILYSNICPQQLNKKAKAVGAVKSEQGISAAQVIVEQTALMSRADAGSRIIRRVALGERFVLTGEEPTGGWYRVLDRKTNKLGWLDANHFKIVEGEKRTIKKIGVKNKKRSRK